MKERRARSHRLNGYIRHMSLVVLVVATSLGASATDYYVDKLVGADTFPGTATQSWRTLNKANLTVQPGDIVNILEGEYIRDSIAPAVAGTFYAMIWADASTRNIFSDVWR